MRQRGKGFTFIVWLDFCTSDSNRNLKDTLFLPAWNKTGNSEHPVTRVQNTSNNKKKTQTIRNKIQYFSSQGQGFCLPFAFHLLPGFPISFESVPVFRVIVHAVFAYAVGQRGLFFKAGLTYKDGNSIRNNYFLINWIILFLGLSKKELNRLILLPFVTHKIRLSIKTDGHLQIYIYHNFQLKFYLLID